MTAKNPAGPWSDPVWLKDAPGIDPSLFFDEDGRCYYTGNRWDFKSAWPAQCAVWMQELDLQKRCLVGERKTLAYGHAANAKYAEGPHLYKIKDHYLLLMAEGGSDYNHAVTALTAKSLWGPYVPCTVNPVLTHRHLGKDYPVQSLGHADLVQTPTGDWYAVFLGKRIVEGGLVPLGRETFLCEVRRQINRMILKVLLYHRNGLQCVSLSNLSIILPMATCFCLSDLRWQTVWYVPPCFCAVYIPIIFLPPRQ